MNPIISFVSGIIASMTPCIIVLLPILLYRFHKHEKIDVKEIIQFSIGFLIPFIIIGSVFSSLYNSSIQDGIKLGLGLLFVVLGILAIKNKINPLNIKVVKNPFLFGSLFSLALSVNPCTIPYTGIILTLSKTEVFLQMFVFGLGLITPSIIFSLIGQKLINFSKKNSKTIKKVTHIMNFILLASGVYIISTIQKFSFNDGIVAIIFISIIFLILLKSYFVINNKKDIKKPINIILLLSLVIILISSIYQCNHYIKESMNTKYISEVRSLFEANLINININNTMTNHEHESCSSFNKDCESCNKCITIFSIGTLIGFIAIILRNKI